VAVVVHLEIDVSQDKRAKAVALEIIIKMVRNQQDALGHHAMVKRAAAAVVLAALVVQDPTDHRDVHAPTTRATLLRAVVVSKAAKMADLDEREVAVVDLGDHAEALVAAAGLDALEEREARAAITLRDAQMTPITRESSIVIRETIKRKSTFISMLIGHFSIFTFSF
jgi:hypothetical protein